MAIDPQDEVLRLRTELRELVALSAIPAAWVGREPQAIAAGLADVLVGSLHLDFAFVRLCDPNGGAAVEVTRGNGWKTFPAWRDKHLAAAGGFSRKEIILDVGGGAEPCRGMVMPVGVNAEGGLVAVACVRSDFPTEIDQLLLSVAVNHAATAFQNSRLIQERRSTEAALRQSEERFRGTFENAAVGIAHEDLAGRFLRFNERFCAILGYLPKELVGKTPSEVTHPEDLAADLARFGVLTRGESSSYTMEKRFIRKDGTIVWAQLTASLQFDAAGEPTSCIKIIQDISERKRLEAELLQAKEAAESANRAKDEFLANVSHEIRTPMNAILGMAELTLDTRLSDEQRNHVNIVKASAEALLSLINDLLDFSKMEAGRLDLDEADFSLRLVLNETLRAAYPMVCRSRSRR